jgi:glycosyltransferase involved in cell wall biosynthesis
MGRTAFFWIRFVWKVSPQSASVSVEGVLEEKEVVETLTSCDVLLFVRGPISTRRGSAIAGIACGLPIIAYSGTETAAPITEAGVVFYDPQNAGSLGEMLVRVLQDEPIAGNLEREAN